MGRGVLGGAALGLVVALFGAGILSLLAPPPKRATLPAPVAEPAEPMAEAPTEPAPEPTPKVDTATAPSAPAVTAPVVTAPDVTVPETAIDTTPATPQTPVAEAPAAPEMPQPAPVEAPAAPEPVVAAPTEPAAPDTAPAMAAAPDAPQPGGTESVSPEVVPEVAIVDLPAGSAPVGDLDEAAPVPDEHARIVVTPQATPPTPPSTQENPVVAEAAPAALPRPAVQPEAPDLPVAEAAPEVEIAGLPPETAQPQSPVPANPPLTGPDQLPQIAPTAIPTPQPPAAALPEVPSEPEPQTPVAEPLPPETAPAEPAPLPRILRPTPEPAPSDERVEPAPETPDVTTPERSSGALRVAVPGREIAVPKVRINRLPSIGGEAPAPAAPGNPNAQAAPGDDAGALVRNAAAFDPVAGKPLFAVILVDTPETRLSGAALRELAFPVSFAVDASDRDATAAAQAYRDAGHEVIMVAGGLPQGATAQDVEVSLTTYLKRVPNAVAVMDAQDGGFQSNRPLLRQVMAIVNETGHGLVSFERGLNAAKQVARSEGVPNAMVFRVLDAKGETEGTMRRYLDRAAFKAGQEGQVVMLGHTRPETLATLITWALDGKGSEMNLAPISAVLAGQ